MNLDAKIDNNSPRWFKYDADTLAETQGSDPRWESLTVKEAFP